jgi:hypothetical protein
MSVEIIEFDKVVAGYSPSLTILNESTLDARKGEITLLIGQNGAGKSRRDRGGARPRPARVGAAARPEPQPTLPRRLSTTR